MLAQHAGAREPVRAYIGLGANLGDARAALLAAMQAVADLPQMQLMRRSSLYRSAPVQAHGPDFINAVVAVDTCLNALELLSKLQQIENAAGRVRPYPNAPRTLDLDLLLYGSAQISSTILTVPHPRMAERAFVLLPLAEIAHEMVNKASLAGLSDQRIERLA
ncbi:MAG: 2-amino-4-hydroxy-6-hydroxymethyldihydropteridine diphosphokinase [Comamonadaceae bacterium CG1_02_60_18]|nr:MAG: 2-amino-4-hydroxy-6-hydroxymethyldihydropteridine diphosphokinase [Comamonadaceae bacterium CG1_02_60_18]PIQ52781.1 MAG: 2-amino-4-hydroxy-6-hydroxymethyldihydropteridine diphosphokinase [Comamonadaceae bacterium CG12_big_fil_rev_8_21_14_0_65_59_15]